MYHLWLGSEIIVESSTVIKFCDQREVCKGPLFILRKGIDLGVGGCLENGNFPLLYVMKMSLCRGWVVLKSLKTPLRNIKMAPNTDNITEGYFILNASTLIQILK